MKTIFLLLLLLGHAKANVEERAQILLKAKNIHHLRSDLKKHKELSILKRSCQIQLQEQKIPVACYQVLKLQKKVHKIPNSYYVDKINEYDHACEDAVDKQNDIVDTRGLGKNCAALVGERNKEINYSQKYLQ